MMQITMMTMIGALDPPPSGTLSINGRAVETTEPQLLMRAVHPHGREWAERYEETLPGGVTHAVHDLTEGAIEL